MANVLFAWLGKTDIRASTGSPEDKSGPILQGIRGGRFERLVLLSNYPPEEAQKYVTWLKEQEEIDVLTFEHKLTSPTYHHEIYKAVCDTIVEYKKDNPLDASSLYFHLSPGTPAMHSIWLLLSKTKYPAHLIETSREAGYREVQAPFEISAEFVPDLIKATDNILKDLNLEKAPQWAEFSKIIHKSAPMKRAIGKAIKVAPRDVPVLIEGESGTGKELFARAIHQSSERKGSPFIPVNCGAIPKDLVESEMFGHIKGAFTGATANKKGYFEAANGGTVFLDEIGELPLDAQVKLLRVLQQSELTPVGANTPIKINVRVISATNRDLMSQVAQGAFREDLFYRLAVAVIKLPPLRERPGDLGVLIDHILAQINQEYTGQPGYTHKKLSIGARNLMLEQSWMGNVRELQNTLRRAAIWSEGGTIGELEIKESLLPSIPKGHQNDDITSPDEPINLPEFIAKTARKHIERAYKVSGSNKSQAARLLGLPNYQTFSNWAEKYGAKL